MSIIHLSLYDLTCISCMTFEFQKQAMRSIYSLFITFCFVLFQAQRMIPCRRAAIGPVAALNRTISLNRCQAAGSQLTAGITQIVVRQNHDGSLRKVRSEHTLAACVKAVAVDQREDRIRLSDHERAH